MKTDNTPPANETKPKRQSFRDRLSPINKRRLDIFKANKRGYYSLWIFVILFGISLLAPILANDRPILASYKGELLFPVLVDYPEEKFGGFLAETDYRDTEIQNEIRSNGWMLWPPISYNYRTINLEPPGPAPTNATRPTVRIGAFASS